MTLGKSSEWYFAECLIFFLLCWMTLHRASLRWVSQILFVMLNVIMLSFAFIIIVMLNILSVIFSYSYAACHFTTCHYAACHYAACNYAACHYTACHYAACHYAACHYAAYHYAACHYAACHYAACNYAVCHPFSMSIWWVPHAECHYAECRHTECRGAVFLFLFNTSLVFINALNLSRLLQHLQQLRQIVNWYFCQTVHCKQKQWPVL